MRVVAILASYNEELFIQPCFDHFISHGVEIYLIDNESTDRTFEVAREYLGNGLIGLEKFSREGVYRWHPILRRKEELADELKADWLIHADPDEIRLPPHSSTTLSAALEEVDRGGYNAVNFKNFLFLPTLESPDHEHARFRETMRWYRYMEPSYPNQVKAWKRRALTAAERLKLILSRQKLRRSLPVNLAETGGHKVSFEGLKLCPTDFIMKHYQVLSLRHAVIKYVEKAYAPEEVNQGWHGWKALAEEHHLRLPSQREMREFTSDEALDTSDPITRTLLYSPEPTHEAS